MNGEDAADILLVEDSPLDAEMTLRALRGRGFGDRTVWVRDGEEALAFLDSHAPPKLVLLELKMPKVDGFDVLRAFRSSGIGRTVPVVVLTSSTQEEDVSECYRLGANGFVAKPIDLQELENAVHRIGEFWLLANRVPRSESPPRLEAP
jgi:CheY-like chemotaxis protein